MLDVLKLPVGGGACSVRTVHPVRGVLPGARPRPPVDTDPPKTGSERVSDPSRGRSGGNGSNGRVIG